MKKILAVFIIFLFLGMGCEQLGLEGSTKIIDGIEYKKYGGEYQPIGNFCINCGEYCLSKHCWDCGAIQPSTYRFEKVCPNCKNETVFSAMIYCSGCGTKMIWKEAPR